MKDVMTQGMGIDHNPYAEPQSGEFPAMGRPVCRVLILVIAGMMALMFRVPGGHGHKYGPHRRADARPRK